MSVARCPECGEEVSIPSGVSTEAIVACPLCRAEFPILRVYEKLPAMLIVVSDPKGTIAAGVADDDALKIAVEPAGRFGFEEGAAPQAQPFTPVSRPSSGPKRRKQSAAGSGLASMFAVVFGGACAIPLAQLCLWWIFGQDPVKVGPTVAKYVPVVVPEKFRGGPLANLDLEVDDKSQKNDSKKKRAEGVRSIPGRSESNSKKTNDTKPTEPDKSNTNPEGNPSETKSPLVVPPPGESGKNIPPPLENVTQPASIKEMKSVSADDLQGVFDSYLLIADDVTDLASKEPSEKSSTIDSAYESWIAIAEAVAYVDPSIPEISSVGGAIDQNLRINLANKELLAAFESKSNASLAAPLEGGSKGELVIGKIEEITKRKDFRSLQIRTADDQVVEVLGWAPLPQEIKEDRRVFILGSRVSDLTPLQLESNSKVTVLGGFVVLLPEGNGSEVNKTLDVSK